MSANKPRLLVTGASGQLGHLVIEHLRRLDPSAGIAAMVRTPEAADELAPFRVATRIGDYTDPASLDAALTGIDRLLLISSSVLGQRAAHHKNVIEAATRSSVSLIAYTSVLRADTSELSLAAEHLATETMLRETGLPYVILRKGWYLENDTAMLAPAVAPARSSAAPATDDFRRRADRTMRRRQHWSCCTGRPPVPSTNSPATKRSR
jgi:NAD(P)H dehydrogenase (quinone)